MASLAEAGLYTRYRPVDRFALDDPGNEIANFAGNEWQIIRRHVTRDFSRNEVAFHFGTSVLIFMDEAALPGSVRARIGPTRFKTRRSCHSAVAALPDD